MLVAEARNAWQYAGAGIAGLGIMAAGEIAKSGAPNAGTTMIAASALGFLLLSGTLIGFLRGLWRRHRSARMRRWNPEEISASRQFARWQLLAVLLILAGDTIQSAHSLFGANLSSPVVALGGAMLFTGAAVLLAANARYITATGSAS